MSAGWRRDLLRADAVPPGPLVVKIGGSLLERVGWTDAVHGLVASLPAPRVLVVGGGTIVDGLRAMDASAPLPADLVHRLAIACMGLTARLVSTMLAVPLIEDVSPGDPPTVVLDVPAWLGRAGRFDRLPVGWHVTSDSIAATVAAELEAALLLVKSIAPPRDDIETLAATGWVDGHFPQASRPLARIEWAAPA